MRAFGIFAALAAFTSVLAAPMAAPAKEIQARHDSGDIITVTVNLNPVMQILQPVVNEVTEIKVKVGM